MEGFGAVQGHGLSFFGCCCFLHANFTLRLFGKRLDMRKDLEKSLGWLLSKLCRNQGRNVGSFAQGDNGRGEEKWNDLGGGMNKSL